MPGLDGADPRRQLPRRRRCPAAGGTAGSQPADQPLLPRSLEVSNDRFAAFVAAAGYITLAERPLSAERFPALEASERAPGSPVFQPVGPGSDLAGRGQLPVVRVADEDAEAFARWAGYALPREAQCEFAARGGLNDPIVAWCNSWNPHRANTWQGPFPSSNTAEDGYLGTAPVGSFPASVDGLFDRTGNATSAATLTTALPLRG